MTTPPPFTLTNESVVIVWEGKTHNVRKDAPNYLHIRRAILEERWDEIGKHLTVAKSLESWAQGKFTVKGNTIYFDGVELPQDINLRISEMAAKGEDPTRLFRFWERLQKNPSFRSVQQLWPFLKHQGIPLTDDGCFLAYKSVQAGSFLDHHSRTVVNKPGTVHEMPRNKISDDPKEACHYGYHVGALEYAKTFGRGDSVLVICKVDPEHVVCVPYDESQRKMRVCKYEVVGIHNGQHLPSTSFDHDTHEVDELQEEDEKAAFNKENPDGNLPSEEVEEEIEVGEDIKTEQTRLLGVLQQRKDAADQESSDIDDGDEEGDHPVYTSPAPKEEPKAEAAPAPKSKPKKETAEKLAAQAKVTPTEKFLTDMSKKDTSELLKEPLDMLRTYATYGLKIVGASKISGGKVALVTKIIEIREKSTEGSKS